MHNHHQDHQTSIEILPWVLGSLPFLFAIALYIFIAIRSNRCHKKWPAFRYGFWIAGVIAASLALTGPIANLAHTDFTAHMMGHLLLGMLSPLLLVLAAPMTLLLRSIPVNAARQVTKVLKSRFVRAASDPLVASILNVGGLWLLYTTSLFSLMHDYVFLYFFIHLHVFFAGYLFTLSMIHIEPTPHRTSYLYRAMVLILALAAHGILSKFIYANPPTGVPASQAETGGMLMYYGGDAIDLILIFILCLHWFRATKPKESMAIG